MGSVPWSLALAGLLVASVVGCASSRGVSLRSAPQSPLVDRLKLTSYWGPQASERTMQTLRVCNLADDLAEAWCLVTYVSNAAVDAICAGVPAIVTGACA
ncbi:hypothetical protein LCGC14_2750750, partial [marine sediment metagenome]